MVVGEVSTVSRCLEKVREGTRSWRSERREVLWME